MAYLELYPLDLTMFDEGGSGAGNSGGAAGAAGTTSSGPSAALRAVGLCTPRCGGVSSGLTATSPASGEGNAAEASAVNGRASSRRGGRSGGDSNVVYGKQATSGGDSAANESDAGSDDGAQESAEDRDARWQTLIKGEFRDQYTRSTQDIIDRRFRQSREQSSQLQQRLDSHQNLLDMMAARYKIYDASDIASIQKAFENDSTAWESAADEGTEVQQAKKAADGSTTVQPSSISPPHPLLRRTFPAGGEGIVDAAQARRESAADEAGMTQKPAGLRVGRAPYRPQAATSPHRGEAGSEDRRPRGDLRAAARVETGLRPEERARQWADQAQAVKQMYPGFDLAGELRNNPNFGKLLNSGISVQQAYEVSHIDDIKNGLVSSTKQQAEKAVAANVRARGSRPAENGSQSSNAVSIRNDVHKLTRADRAAIADRVRRGERISF